MRAEKIMIKALGFHSTACTSFLGTYCLDAHITRHGWMGESLGLPTRQGTLISLRTGDKGGREVRGVRKK